MEHEIKFIKIQDLVLYNLARNKKPADINEILNLSSNLVNPKQIYRATLHLRKRRLIKKLPKEIGKPIKFSLELSQLEKIKKILSSVWESSWGDAWTK